MSRKLQPQGLLNIVKRYFQIFWTRYQRLNFYGKAFIWSAVLFYVVVGMQSPLIYPRAIDPTAGTLSIVIGPNRIAQFLYDEATKVANAKLGWLAMAGIIVLISFPPLIGHTTCVTLCGFAYGMKGFFISAPASLVGAGLVLVALRSVFGQRLKAWSKGNSKWQALEAVIRAKGLPLIILIRVSPFPPWVYSNSLFASIESVALWQFLIATIFTFPKLLLHTFIGSRAAALSDGESRSHMDGKTKALNATFVGAGILIAIGASGLVYNLVQKHIKHLDGLPPEVDRLAAEAIEDFDEADPLLGPVSPRTSIEG